MKTLRVDWRSLGIFILYFAYGHLALRVISAYVWVNYAEQINVPKSVPHSSVYIENFVLEKQIKIQNNHYLNRLL